MLILCLKVFFARILDVSLGTIRTMFVVKGKRLNGALIGFFEVLIWFLVVREALQTGVDNIFVAVSYASGFAIGTYIGGFLLSILITRKIGVQVFTDSKDLIEVLRDKNYAVSVIECHGYNETDKQGNKTVRDFYGDIKGYYKKSDNTTRDFYQRIVARGDQSGMLLTME